jgi:hypothetical protein
MLGRMRAAAPLVFAFSIAALVACGGKQSEPQTVTGGPVPDPAPSANPACKDAPPDPGVELSRQPQIIQACLANAAKVDANLCGSAKIDVRIGKDGKVSQAEVAQSTLPLPVTDCIKARLAAMQFACPSEGSASYTVPVGLPGGGPNGECPGVGSPATPPKP